MRAVALETAEAGLESMAQKLDFFKSCRKQPTEQMTPKKMETNVVSQCGDKLDAVF